MASRLPGRPIGRSLEMSSPEHSGNVLLNEASGETKRVMSRPAADIVFIIDTTGSMDDKINGLLQTCAKFLDELARKRIDWRIAVIAFGDLTVPGDTIQATGFMNNVETVKKVLMSVPRNNGGGNDGESSLEAIDKALSLRNYRKNAIKAFIVITDEPALQNHRSAATMIKTLRSKEIIAFVVSPEYQYYEDMATQTGGQWFQITPTTDFTSILKMFDKLTETITQTVETIQLHGGTVSRYLQLKAPPTPKP